MGTLPYRQTARLPAEALPTVAPRGAERTPATRQVELMGMAIDAVAEHEAIATVLAALDQGSGGTVLTPNLDHMRQHSADPDVRELYRRADLVLADGMPLVWACRLLGEPLPARVAGSDLIDSLSAAAARAGRSVFLLGGNPGTARAAAEVLGVRHAGLRVAGTLCPPMGFERSERSWEEVCRTLERTRPDIVFVGIGFPRSGAVAERLLAEILPTAWFLTVGVSFSFLAGEIPRAPRAMQALGLEWLHRLCQEPRRLFHRYVVEDMPFAARVGGHVMRRRATGA